MVPEVKDKWISALLSNEFNQGIGCLKKLPPEGVISELPVQHCCLGVLCELYIRENPGKGDWSPHAAPSGSVAFLWNPDGKGGYAESGNLPAPVMEWAGLKVANPRFFSTQTEEHTTLAEVNDEGNSFLEIANVIKEKL